MNLRAFKVARGLSEPELARLLGFPHSTVVKWLRQDRMPDACTVERIVAATHGEVTAAGLRPDWAAVFMPAGGQPGITTKEATHGK